MLTGETRQQTRERNVKTILKAAERVFAEAGYKGSSISMIAEEAGVPKSNIVYYFHSKEALYRRVIEDIFHLWLDASKGMDGDMDPAQALTMYIHDKMELSRQRPHGSKVWANEIIHGAPFAQEYIENELKAWIATRERIFKRWMADGRIKQMDPKAILYLIWATTQHYADFQHQITALNGNKPMNNRQWQDAKASVTTIILDGIGLRPSPERDQG